jgi:AAA family ATP:ADP antiporter
MAGVESTLVNPALGAGRLSPLERFLRLFTDVRAGEGGTALLMLANAFLILCSYYFVKPLRDGWISISDVAGLGKWEVRAYSSFAQCLLLIPIVGWYGRLATRLPRASLITCASLFCMANVLVFWMLRTEAFYALLPYSGILFYLWVGIFGVFVVAQFFAFAADVYDERSGERMLPMIAIGATAGAAGGAAIAGLLVDSQIPEEMLLLLALIPLGLSILLTRSVDGRVRPPGVTALPPAPPDSGGVRSVFDLVLNHRFLLAIAGITLLVNWVNTNGENLLFKVLQETVAREVAAQGVEVGSREWNQYWSSANTLFYANFYAWVNAVALVLQAFVASRLLKYGGISGVLLLLPVVSLVSYSVMWLVPILGVVKVMKIAENAADYSINNTARHVLWLPVPPGMTYQGKPTIDSFVTRIGDGLAALTVLVGGHVLALATDTFFVFNVVLVLAWLVLCFEVIRRYRAQGEGAASA